MKFSCGLIIHLLVNKAFMNTPELIHDRVRIYELKCQKHYLQIIRMCNKNNYQRNGLFTSHTKKFVVK